MGMGGGAGPWPGAAAAGLADRDGFFFGGGGGGFFFPIKAGDPDGDGGAAAMVVACFCAQVAAVLAAADSLAGAAEVPSLAKRFCSSLSWDGGVAFGRGGFGGAASSAVPVWLGEDEPMPKAGTEMPAAPSLWTAP